MKQRSLLKTILLSVLLAAVCIGAVELAVCRVADPELYETLVTPVRILYHDARSQVKSLSGQYALWLTDQAVTRQKLALVQRVYAAERRETSEERRRWKETLRRWQEEQRRLEEERRRTGGDQDAGDSPEDSFLLDENAITQFLVDEDQEYLLGGNRNLVYYHQKDEAWAEAPYGRDRIGRFGCGPTVLAMAVSTLTGNRVTPAEMASWAALAGYAAPGSGSYLSIVQGTAKQYALDCTSLRPLTVDVLEEALDTGGMVVALMGPGHFTKGGHFILIHGTTLTGGVLVADPNSRENSLTVWDPQTIVEELSPSRHDGAPLWLLTPSLVL